MHPSTSSTGSRPRASARTRGHSQEPLQYAGIPVPGTEIGIQAPGMRGRLLASRSPRAGVQAFLGAVCQSKYLVLVYPRTAVAVPGAVLPFGFAHGRHDDNE